MPLSEHEQRILEEMERRLAAEDPKFARHVAATGPQGTALRRVKRGVGVFVLGFGLLVAGLFVPHLLVAFGIAAFALMVASAAVIASSVRQVGQERAGMEQQASTWFSRMEERWRKRFERGEGT